MTKGRPFSFDHAICVHCDASHHIDDDHQCDFDWVNSFQKVLETEIIKRDKPEENPKRTESDRVPSDDTDKVES